MLSAGWSCCTGWIQRCRRLTTRRQQPVHHLSDSNSIIRVWECTLLCFSNWHDTQKISPQFFDMCSQLLHLIFLIICYVIICFTAMVNWLFCVTEWPVMCWGAVKILLTHSWQTDAVVSKAMYVFTFFQWKKHDFLHFLVVAHFLEHQA